MTHDKSRPTVPWQVILMFAIIIGTLLAGYLVFPTTDEQRRELLAELGTTNKGELLRPVLAIEELALADGKGLPWRHADQRRKWRIVIPATGDCSQACQDRLYITRQVHVRLAKYSTRVERVFVDLGGGNADELDAFLAAEHPHVQHLHASPEAFERWLSGSNLQWSPGDVPAIVIDPAGGAMMFYSAEHDGTHMLEDLTHLLKFSKE